MSKPIRLLTALIFSVALISTPAQASEQSKHPLVSELTAMLEGEFESRNQMEEDRKNSVPKEQTHGWVNRRFINVDAPKLSTPALVTTTLYRAKSWFFDENEFLVWTFEVIENGNVVLSTPRRFKNQEKLLPFARDAERLPDFSEDDLEPARSGAACQVYWKKTKQGFSGATRNCNEMSTVRHKMMNWDWRYQLQPDALFVEFVGTDETGAVLDRTPKDNPYRLDRIGASDVTAMASDEAATNAVLRTATIYVKDWDASIKFYTDYLGYSLLVEQQVTDEKSLTTLGARPGMTARIAYLKPVNNRIQRPFAGNYLGLIGFSGPGHDDAVYQRAQERSSAVLGEIVLAHQVVGIEPMYAAMQNDPKVTIVATLSPSGTGASRSYSVIDPNGVRVEIYEYIEGKEPTKNP